MSEEQMEWEGAEERFVEGYSGFNTSVIYVLTFVVALLVWMFLFIVVAESSILAGIFWFIVCTIAGIAAAIGLNKMMVG